MNQVKQAIQALTDRKAGQRRTMTGHPELLVRAEARERHDQYELFLDLLKEDDFLGMTENNFLLHVRHRIISSQRIYASYEHRGGVSPSFAELVHRIRKNVCDITIAEIDKVLGLGPTPFDLDYEEEDVPDTAPAPQKKDVPTRIGIGPFRARGFPDPR